MAGPSIGGVLPFGRPDGRQPPAMLGWLVSPTPGMLGWLVSPTPAMLGWLVSPTPAMLGWLVIRKSRALRNNHFSIVNFN